MTINPISYSPPQKSVQLFRKTSKVDDNITILFLGAHKNPVVDLRGKGKKLDFDHYFYERISVKTQKGKIHLCGQVLKKYVDQWKTAKTNNKTTDEFQIWMEKQAEEPVAKKDIIEKSVRYFNKHERKQTEIHCVNDSLQQIGLDKNSREKKPLEAGEYAFVVGKIYDKTAKKLVTKFYATPKIKTAKGGIQHSSFLKGGNVKSAGMLTINDKGQITRIRNISGHYKPTDKELARLIKHLNDSGYNVSQIHITTYKNNFYRFVSLYLNINFKWGIVNQRADKWYAAWKLIDESDKML